jgi:hypothetical protein
MRRWLEKALIGVETLKSNKTTKNIIKYYISGPYSTNGGYEIGANPNIDLLSRCSIYEVYGPMIKTVRLHEQTHKRLMSFVGSIQAKNGEHITANDALELLLRQKLGDL